jgi:hypothetical protein
VSALPGVRAELAASVRRVNSWYSRIPENRRPDVDGSRWRELEAELDECFAAGDREGARRAIERWERHARAVLAPLVDREREQEKCTQVHSREAGRGS